MKILITGAKGFVGQNLAASLKNIKDGKDRTCLLYTSNSLLNAIISTDSDISKCDYFRGKLTKDKDTYDVSVVNSKKIYERSFIG